MVASESAARYPDLAGRTVFVSGGGSGIGAAFVRAFAGQGASVAFIDIAEAPSQALADELGATVAFWKCDVRDIGALQSVITETARKFGPVRVLVNNAARDDRHAFDDVTPEYWDDNQAVNLRHQFFAAQAVYPDMAALGGGAIVNLGSTSWMVGQGGMPGYTAAKSAVVGLTRGLARDLGPHGIRVTCVVPGWIMTERQIKLWLTPESEAELLRRQCLKRKLVPADIARAVLFFAADDSAACTAQSYVVDGGWT